MISWNNHALLPKAYGESRRTVLTHGNDPYLCSAEHK